MDERQRQENRRTFQTGLHTSQQERNVSQNNETDSKKGISGSTWVQMANRNFQQMHTNEQARRTHTTGPYVQKQKSLDDDREETWDEEEEEVQAMRDRERRRRIYLAQKRKKKQQKKILVCTGVILVSILVCWFAIHTVSSAVEEVKEKEQQDVALISPSPVVTAEITKELEQAIEEVENVEEVKEEVPAFEITVQEKLLTPNEYSRPGLAMEPITGVVIHYVGNPGTQGISNRNFFESLKDNHETSVSSHFIIGLQGEIIQCVPLDEVAYANRGRNFDTISIECCHPDEEGQFNEATYEALVQLAAYLLNTYGLGEEALLRHYEVTGKICPRYYVENPEAWETLKNDIMKEVEEHPNSVLVME